MVRPRFGRAGFGVGKRKVAVIYPASRWVRVARVIMEIRAFPSLSSRRLADGGSRWNSQVSRNTGLAFRAITVIPYLPTARLTVFRKGASS